MFTLDKNQCRGVDLQTNSKPSNRYDEPTGVPLKGDNLARMLALRSRGNMCCVERIADEMMVYGLVRFGKIWIIFQLNSSNKTIEILSLKILANNQLNVIVPENFETIININTF